MPVRSWYVENDDICENEGNIKVGNTIPGQSSRVTFTDGRTHYGMSTSIIGDNDPDYYNLLLAKLGRSDDIMGLCQFFIFNNWGWVSMPISMAQLKANRHGPFYELAK